MKAECVPSSGVDGEDTGLDGGSGVGVGLGVGVGGRVGVGFGLCDTVTVGFGEGFLVDLGPIVRRVVRRGCGETVALRLPTPASEAGAGVGVALVG